MFQGVNYRHFMLDKKKNLVVTNLKASVQNIIRQKKKKRFRDRGSAKVLV